MRLQTRLTITATSIITAVSVAVGLGAISSGYQNDITDVDTKLAGLAKQIAGASGQELSVALLVGGSIGDDLSIGLYDINRQLTSVQDGTVDLTLGLSHRQMLDALPQAVEVVGQPPYRLRAVKMADNELVLLALPIDGAQQTREANLAALAWYVLFADILAALGVGFLVRRDLRGIGALIEQAQRVSVGQSHDIADIGSGTNDTASEVAQLAHALHTMVDRLQNAKVGMQQFLGDASHELRTPLTTIRGYLDLLAKDPGLAASPTATKAVPIMAGEAARMQQLIEDLLLLAELGEAKPQADLGQTVDLSRLVQGQFEQLRDLQPNRNVELQLESCTVAGNAALLARLVANLVSNQKRHTPDNTHTLVGLVASDGWAVLTIDDSGPGLPAKAYANGPRRFERFDSSRSQASGGSGLGMSIMSQIVAAHGGQFDLAPSTLGGLKTQIRLPLNGFENT
mgnify:CR=1 FL=1